MNLCYTDIGHMRQSCSLNKENSHEPVIEGHGMSLGTVTSVYPSVALCSPGHYVSRCWLMCLKCSPHLATWVDLWYPLVHLWTHQRCLDSMPHFLLSYYLAFKLLNKHWLLSGSTILSCPYAPANPQYLQNYCTVTAVNLQHLQLPKFRSWDIMLHKGGYTAALVYGTLGGTG